MASDLVGGVPRLPPGATVPVVGAGAMMAASAARLAAVLTREVRTLSRGKAGFALRVVYALGLSAFAWFLADSIFGYVSRDGMWPVHQMQGLASRLFLGLAWVEGLGALLLGTVLGLASTWAERRDHTLGLMVLSPMHASELVAGKSLALLGLLAMVLAAPLPLFALAGWGGGMDYGWLGVLLVVVLAFAALGVALGTWCALRARGPASAGILAMLVLAGLLGWSMWVDRAPAFLQRGLRWAHLDGTHPIHAIDIVAQQGLVSPLRRGWLVPTALTAAGAVLLLLMAARELPRAPARRRQPRLRLWFGRLDAWYERVTPRMLRFELAGGGGPRGNPVAWLASTRAASGAPTHAFRIAAAMTVFWLLAFGIMPWHTWHVPLRVLFIFALLASAFVGGATALAGERRSRSFEVLLTSPISATSILWGKTRAWAKWIAFLAIPYLTLSLLVQFQIDRDEFVLSAFGYGLVLALTAATYSLTLAASLHASTSLRAGILGGLALLTAHVLPLLTMVIQGSASDRGASAWLAGRYGLAGAAVAELAIAVWASRRRRRGIASVALLVGLLTAAGLILGLPVGEHAMLVETLADPLEEALVGLGWISSWMAGDAAGFFLWSAGLVVIAVGAWLWTALGFHPVTGRAR